MMTLPTHRPPTHPGEMLLEEFLRPMGMPQTVAAKRMDIPTQRLNEVIRGKRGMTADTAIRSIGTKTAMHRVRRLLPETSAAGDSRPFGGHPQAPLTSLVNKTD